ncbi:prepilin-type N-terminal cleavage/methylation domain-containing protein [Blautia sp.]|uniref:prepilin-type N-terminal cleavage/methylation domain-containing protein n=1 Tax=Blautia sp. TaxID=1955243 RepID=UPI003FA461DF
MQRNDKGFTLIELVVVIAILAAPQMNISQFRITSILVLLLRIFLKKEKNILF